MIYSLVQRNNKMFLRNKMLVFLSLLTVMIVIGLYVIFLQKMQLDSIEAVMPLTTDSKVMVNEWMISGLISIIAVTTTLGVFSIYVQDLETKANADFLTTSISRYSIQFSYCISSFLMGFVLTCIAFMCCQLFLLLTGGTWLSWMETLQVIGIIFISVILSSVLNLLIVLFIQTQAAFSTVNTIIGTVIGFLCGVYVPIGTLPEFVQTVIHFFPISHTALLLREVIMTDSIEKVFPTEQAAEEYMLTYGVQYEISGTMVEPWMSIVFIFGTIAVIGVIAGVLFARRNK
jgi:multidrug/hemolysin transport system permease protein